MFHEVSANLKLCINSCCFPGRHSEYLALKVTTVERSAWFCKFAYNVQDSDAQWLASILQEQEAHSTLLLLDHERPLILLRLPDGAAHCSGQFLI